MIIAYVLGSLNLGGAEKITLDTAIAMKDRGHQVFVIGSSDKMKAYLMGYSIGFHKLNINPNTKNIISFLYIFFHIYRFVKKYKIEIIHTAHRWPNFVCFFVAYLTGARLIWTDHNILKDKKALTLYKDKVISVSVICKKHLVEYFNIPGEKIAVIHNGIKPLEYPTNKEMLSIIDQAQLPSSAKIVSVIARLSEQKGHKYLFHAIPKIIKCIPNTHFLIAGDGELREYLERLSRELSISQNVHFLGERKDVLAILAVSDVLALASLWEGFPLVILEAYSLAKPVIATAVGGVEELVLEGKTGYLLSPKDSIALTDAIVKLLSNQETMQKMGKEGKNLVERKFKFSNMISKIEKVYQEVIQNK